MPAAIQMIETATYGGKTLPNMLGQFFVEIIPKVPDFHNILLQFQPGYHIRIIVDHSHPQNSHSKVKLLL